MSISGLMCALVAAGFFTRYIFGLIRYNKNQPLEAVEHYFIWVIMLFSTGMFYGLIMGLRVIHWTP